VEPGTSLRECVNNCCAVVQAAADAAPSAMVSVIGLDSDKVEALCNAANEEVSEDKKVQIANFLCPVSCPIYFWCCSRWCCWSTYMSRYAYGPSLWRTLLFSCLYELCKDIFLFWSSSYWNATKRWCWGSCDYHNLPGKLRSAGGVKGVEAVEAKAKSFKARMTVNILTFFLLI